MSNDIIIIMDALKLGRSMDEENCKEGGWELSEVFPAAIAALDRLEAREEEKAVPFELLRDLSAYGRFGRGNEREEMGPIFANHGYRVTE